MTLDEKIGKTLRRYRIMQGLTQAELGFMLDLSAQQVQKYESGANRITVARLVEISRVLGLSVLHFLAGLVDKKDILNPPPEQYDPLTFKLIESFRHIHRQEHKDLICALTQALGEGAQSP